MDTVIELYKAGMFWVCRLIHRVVACDPLFVLVMLGDFRPEPNQSILVVLVDPETSDVCAMVGVPSSILPSWCSVHIEDGVDTLLGAEADYAIKVSKPIFFQYSGIHVVLEVAVVDRNSNAVEAERLEEYGVILHEEVFQKL